MATPISREVIFYSKAGKGGVRKRKRERERGRVREKRARAENHVNMCMCVRICASDICKLFSYTRKKMSRNVTCTSAFICSGLFSTFLGAENITFKASKIF